MTNKQEETKQLTDRYGQPEIINAALPTGLFDPMSIPDRDSEIVAAILRPTGKLILITKPFYPTDTYRLPSGGVEIGESIESALHREIYEETGLQVEILHFVAIIHYSAETTQHTFTSHVFLVKEIGGELVCHDVEEQISGFREIAPIELKNIIAHLQSIRGDFEEWAQFRAVAHEAVLKAFYKEGNWAKWLKG